ncbi:AAA family ATPase [Baia soyae]|uniref:Putative kinase n=1 Tax=Baia soyae TaxID=1544746 RepID=A0A4R2S109_9BACL|nr:AAA family ATPase [Baia soyae]TCP69129.1 putative kinase [Baia soyae]
MEIVILVGIQASGKSTFYRENFLNTHIRLNLDMLKTRHREKILLEACLNAKQSIVIDNTNPTAEDRARYINISKEKGFSIVGYYFEPNYEESIYRNSTRNENEKIPLIGIKSTLKKLVPPSIQEGFDTLYRVCIINGKFVIIKS